MDTRLIGGPAVTHRQRTPPPGPADTGPTPDAEACAMSPAALAWPLSSCPVFEAARASARHWRAITPPPADDAPAADPCSFAALIERPPAPGLEPNARIIQRFNRGDCDADDVLKMTSYCMKKCGEDWNLALACMHALTRCRRQDPATGGEEVVCPTHFGYAIAIGLCQRAGRPDKALALFHHLQRNGPAMPTPTSAKTPVYATAVSACEAEGLADDALALLHHLLKHGPHTHPPAWADAILYNGAIATCKKAGRTDDVLWLLDHLRSYGPVYPEPAFPLVNSYNMAIAACSQDGRHAEAMDRFDEFLKEGPGFRPPAYPDAVTLCSALVACEQLGRFDRYAELLNRGILGAADRPETRAFKPTLGFDAENNRLDLHQQSVLVDPGTTGDHGIHSALVRAIISCLYWTPGAVHATTGINEKTEFVVGRRGYGTVKQTVLACMHALGWNPVYPRGSTGVINRGALVAQPTQAGVSGLNPLAQPWKA